MPAEERRCLRCNGQLYYEPVMLENRWELVCLSCGTRVLVPTAAEQEKERARQRMPPTAEC
jgi:DNA-directed RNA polymerase subunit RPC12/RpoP